MERGSTIKVGDRFGALVVLNLTPYLSMNVSADKVECRCDCGSFYLINYHSLNRRKSCGCGIDRKVNKYSCLDDRQVIYDQIDKAIISYKSGAKNRKIEWKLERWFVIATVLSPCAYCGSMDGKFNGIDRIDSKIGYVDYNCFPCCIKCNLAKSNYNMIEYLNNIVATCSNLNLHNFSSLINLTNN